MLKYLILKLHGPMQAWGEHTFEGHRPSANFPTRSGLLGLLGACLGIGRTESEKLRSLADSIGMAVRVDTRCLTILGGRVQRLRQLKITDYHTVKDARKDYTGLDQHETIQTWREYLLDAEFSVALWNVAQASINLDEIAQAVRQPYFTPYLGRRSCPLARPLFEACLQAENVLDALRNIAPNGGVIYSEEKADVRMMRVRDVPLINQPRQFAARNVYIHGGEYVSE